MALRKPPAGLLPPSDRPAPAERWETYDCELVTPLYGGGVTAGEVDQKMPVRASAIRGQLRFWWRLLARHKWKLGNTDEIRKREFALWGGIGNEGRASKVWLRIDRNSPAKMECAATYPDWQSRANGYALFPAQGKVERGEIRGPSEEVGKAWSDVANQARIGARLRAGRSLPGQGRAALVGQFWWAWRANAAWAWRGADCRT